MPPTNIRRKKIRVLPGFKLTLGFTLFYLGLIVLIPLSAVFCNVVRLIPTVWLYGNVAKSKAEMFHDVAGWLMLPIALLLLFCVLGLLKMLGVQVMTSTAPTSPGNASGSASRRAGRRPDADRLR